MPERSVPPDVADFAAYLLEEWGQQFTGTIGELVQVLREPSPSRSVPSDRWSALQVAVPSGGRATQILGRQLDRARVTIVNIGAVEVSLGNDASVTTTLSGRFDLAPGESLTLDSRAEIWAAAASEGLLQMLVEEWDT